MASLVISSEVESYTKLRRQRPRHVGRRYATGRDWFALRNCTVVSKDGDLSTVPGLHVENWATG